MATYVMNLKEEKWMEIDTPFSTENIEPLLQYVGVGDLVKGFFVASFVKGTEPLYPGTITGQIDVMMVQHNEVDCHAVFARDTLQ